MIPPFISQDVKSTGERQIFDLLKNDPATNSWTVLHSLGLLKHTKKLYGEIDFLVMAPGLGIFCLEVKSGNIKRENGLWKFVNRYGDVTTKTRGPFDQAQEGMFSLLTAIKDKFGYRDRLARLLFGFGVMFPHILYSVNGPDEEGWQVYDRDSRRQPVSMYIKQLARNTRKKMAQEAWFDDKESIPTVEDIKKIADYLRGDFEKMITPRQLMSDIEEQIFNYTREQYQCLDQLEDNPRCIFKGAAGTGKTMLAIESARRSVLSCESVLLVCFNTLLGKWMTSQFDNIADKQIYVGSFHGFLKKIASQSVVETGIDKDEYFKYELPIRALESIDAGLIEPFDKIIIDEGQDLIRGEYLDVLDGLLKGGLAGGKWEIYCDFERQALYAEIDEKTMLEIINSRANYVIVKLTVNCRNTKNIGQETVLVSGFEKPPFKPGTIEGIPVEYHFYQDKKDQAEKIQGVLSRLKHQGISTKDISILSPFRYEESTVYYMDHGMYSIKNLSGDPDYFLSRRTHTFSTIHGFKGLENNHIIIIDINRLNDDEFRSILYVGMSRARVGLYVFVDERAKKDYRELIKSPAVICQYPK